MAQTEKNEKALGFFTFNPYNFLGLSCSMEKRQLNVDISDIRFAITSKTFCDASLRQRVYTCKSSDYDDEKVLGALENISDVPNKVFAFSSRTYLKSFLKSEIEEIIDTFECYDSFLAGYLWLLDNDFEFKEKMLWAKLCVHIDKVRSSTVAQWEKLFDNRFSKSEIASLSYAYDDMHKAFCKKILDPLKSLTDGCDDMTSAKSILYKTLITKYPDEKLSLEIEAMIEDPALKKKSEPKPEPKPAPAPQPVQQRQVPPQAQQRQTPPPQAQQRQVPPQAQQPQRQTPPPAQKTASSARSTADAKKHEQNVNAKAASILNELLSNTSQTHNTKASTYDDGLEDNLENFKMNDNLDSISVDDIIKEALAKSKYSTPSDDLFSSIPYDKNAGASDTQPKKQQPDDLFNSIPYNRQAQPAAPNKQNDNFEENITYGRPKPAIMPKSRKAKNLNNNTQSTPSIQPDDLFDSIPYNRQPTPPQNRQPQTPPPYNNNRQQPSSPLPQNTSKATPPQVRQPDDLFDSIPYNRQPAPPQNRQPQMPPQAPQYNNTMSSQPQTPLPQNNAQPTQNGSLYNSFGLNDPNASTAPKATPDNLYDSFGLNDLKAPTAPKATPDNLYNSFGLNDPKAPTAPKATPDNLYNSFGLNDPKAPTAPKAAPDNLYNSFGMNDPKAPIAPVSNNTDVYSDFGYNQTQSQTQQNTATVSPQPSVPQYNDVTPSQPEPSAPQYNDVTPSQPEPQAPQYNDVVSSQPEPQAPQYSDVTPSQPEPSAPQYNDVTPSQPEPYAPQYSDVTPSQPEPQAPQYNDVTPSQPESSAPQYNDVTPSQPESSAPQYNDVTPSQPEPQAPQYNDVTPSQPESSAPQYNDVTPSQPESSAPQYNDVTPSQPEPSAPQYEGTVDDILEEYNQTSKTQQQEQSSAPSPAVRKPKQHKDEQSPKKHSISLLDEDISLDDEEIEEGISLLDFDDDDDDEEKNVYADVMHCNGLEQGEQMDGIDFEKADMSKLENSDFVANYNEMDTLDLTEGGHAHTTAAKGNKKARPEDDFDKFINQQNEMNNQMFNDYQQKLNNDMGKKKKHGGFRLF